MCILTNCSVQPKKIPEESEFDSHSPNLKSIINNFNTISQDVDKVYKIDTSRIELYMQVYKDSSLIKVENFHNIPKVIYASYNIIKNESDQIIFILENPFSESDDWHIIYESYFDSTGSILAFVRKCSFFNSGCAEIVHEKSEYFFDEKQNLVKKTYKIVDGDNHILDFKKCTFNYRVDYEIRKTLKDYLQSHKFQK